MRGLSSSDRPQNKILVTVGRTVLFSLLLGSLFCFDFILYLRAGNVLGGTGLNMPVLIVMGYLLGTACALMIVTFFSKFLQSLLFAVCTTVLAAAFMNQFLQIDKSQYLNVLLTSLTGDPSIAAMIDGFADWIMFGIIFVIFYLIVSRLSLKKAFFLGLVMWGIVGTLTFTAMMNNNPKPVLPDVYKSTETNFADNNKTIFLFMPNAVSFVALPDKNEKADMLKNVELAFMAKYGFKLYPHAYVKNASRYANLIEVLNILDKKDYNQHLMNNIGLEKLWKFNVTQKPEVFLQDNQLTDVFQKAHYKVNVYQNSRIEICKKNNQYAVDLCRQKTSLPTQIKEFSESDKVSLLINQWLSTVDAVFDPKVTSVTEMFLDRNTLKTMALPYEQLYVVQSFQTLKRVLEDIAENPSKSGVYFVYLDFPNNLFVYDDKCNIKPLNKWDTDNSKYKKKKSSLNADTYADQMLCFWDKMEEFMQSLVELGVYNNLTLIVNGISSGGESDVQAFNFVEQFKKQNTVLFAIHDPHTKFTINNRICSTKDLLRTYLFKAPKCKEFEGLEGLEAMQDNIRVDLVRNKITQSDVTKALRVYKQKLEENKKAAPQTKEEESLIVDREALPVAPKEESEISDNELLSDDAVRALTGGEPAVPQQASQAEEKIEDKTEVNKEAPVDDEQTLSEEGATVKEESAEEDKAGNVPLEHTDTLVEPAQDLAENRGIDSADKIEQQSLELVDEDEPVQSEVTVENKTTEEYESAEISENKTEEVSSEIQGNVIFQPDENIIEEETSVSEEEKEVKEEKSPQENVQTKGAVSEKNTEKPVVKPQAQAEKSVSHPKPATKKTVRKKVIQAPQKTIKVITTTIHAPTVRELEAAPDLNRVIIEQNPEGKVQSVTVPETVPVQVPVSVPEEENNVITVPVVQHTSSQSQEEPLHSEIHTDLSGDFLIIEEDTDWEYDPAKALGVSGEESEQQQVIIKVQ